MIVETESGPDRFVPCSDPVPYVCGKRKEKEVSGKRVWIVQQTDGDHVIEGHYIYERGE